MLGLLMSRPVRATEMSVRAAFAWEDNYPYEGKENLDWADEFDRWLKDVKRIAWFQGASSRQCHCNAYSEGECACGGYPSEPNPYN